MTVQTQRRFEQGPRQWATEGRSLETAEASVGGRWRIIGITIVGLFLLYHVVTKSFSAYLAESNPGAALFLNGDSPTALLNLAQGKLSEDKGFTLLDPVLAAPRNAGPGSTVPKGDDTAALEVPTEIPAPAAQPSTTLDQAAFDEIRELVERAIAQDPLNARAFRILGQISERTSDEMQTQRLMQAAVRRSLLESVAVYWMLRKSFQDQNYKAALGYADILMRTRPQALGYIMPIMGKMAEIPQASDDLKLLLANNPPWRQQFFSYFPRSITDARTTLDFLLSAKESQNPPSASELQPYLDFLIQHGFYDLAYYTWLQFLPAERLTQAGHLYNGGFDATPSGTPFDWVLTKGTGVTAQVAAKGDKPGERALFLQFGPGRVDYREVTELIMLRPANYQFHGKYKGDVISERALEWRVICAGKDQNIIGRGLVARGGSTTQWKDLEFSFAVPEANCPAQYVKLVFDARSASEKFISGSIWFDDFQITREQTAEGEGPGSTPEAAQPTGGEQTLPPAGTEVETSPSVAPPAAGDQSVSPAGNVAATGTSVVAPPAGEITVRPQIFDPSLLAPNPPEASQVQPPQ